MLHNVGLQAVGWLETSSDLQPPNVINQQSAPQDDGVTLDLSKMSSYWEVCQALADALQLDTPAKLRLTQHNNLSGGPSALMPRCMLSMCGLCLTDSQDVSRTPPATNSTALLGLRSWHAPCHSRPCSCRRLWDPQRFSLCIDFADNGVKCSSSGRHQNPENPATPGGALPCRHAQADAHEV